ncbi:hypothetical protein [Algiphilus sp.]|uniref:hypothetical protein n=1 Tax=Algiphilus sp. TaxID=1872431 RepID=UPI0025C0D1FC|nr:hypothetical protein [Algiphilus sp.]MCK5769464.1 hypothetical protein [Algiphilus sp.]
MALAQHKLTLAWPNLIDRCTLSGGSYTAARPLAHAQVRELQERSRTSDAATDSTQLLVTLDQRRTLGGFGIAAHNLSVDATVRIRVRDDSDTTVLDSGHLPAWPGILLPDQLEWEDDNYWFGQLTAEMRAEYTPLFAWFFGPVVPAYSVLVEITDTANADGYIEFGRLFLGNAWQPGINMSYDSQWGHDDATTVEETVDAGAEFFDEAPRRRTFACGLDYLDANDAFNQLFRMQRVQGISGEILIADQLAATPQSHMKTMLARLTQLDPVSHPYHDNWRNTLAAREIL